MAIKKSELYSSLWKSCELRGSMDASEYKTVGLDLEKPRGALPSIARASKYESTARPWTAIHSTASSLASASADGTLVATSSTNSISASVSL